MLSPLASGSFSIASAFFSAVKKSLFDRVNDVFEERVRPVLQMDGGDIVLNDITNGVVTVTLTGHCSGCPSRRQTLNAGILGCLQEEFGDEIVDIREKDAPLD